MVPRFFYCTARPNLLRDCAGALKCAGTKANQDDGCPVPLCGTGRYKIQLQIQIQLQRRPAEAGRYNVRGNFNCARLKRKSRRPLQIQQQRRGTNSTATAWCKFNCYGVRQSQKLARGVGRAKNCNFLAEPAGDVGFCARIGWRREQLRGFAVLDQVAV
jgi:hypothetical protein